MFAEPQKEHEWLQRLVGEWTYEHECVMEPGQPPSKFTGEETVRSVGGLWVVCEGRGAMPEGGTMTSLLTLGYDPVRKRYVGTFLASVMTHLWLYDGGLDPEGTVLTLDTEGPHCSGEGKMAKYKDVIELRSADHRVLTSHMLGDDGKWVEFMTAHYRRVK